MGRIRILSDEVASKIAAGEVVERPASVVKELLENSLDAGATELRIEVSGGGRRLVRVADDGGGMLRDDAMLAFERHATSKLRDARDLFSIATLGFRGEALPSIGAVSRLVLETRTREEATGTRVEAAGGKMLRCDEAALAPGTAVTVRDLFFNVPARKKFLRSEQTELAHIASLVTHYSLAHPDKTFLLMSEAKELLNVTPVEKLRDRVYQVFGSQAIDELVDLGLRERELVRPPPPVPPSARQPEAREREERTTFRLRGFVSRPQVHRLNRNSIFLFVNRRLIRDRLLLHALSAACHNLIPPGSFPFALLFLECDCAEVDVNVHPAKTEVRFRHGSFVHDFVRDSVREALVESKPVSAIPRPARPQPAAELPYSEFSQRIEAETWQDQLSSLSQAPAAGAPGELPEFRLRPPGSPAERLDFGGHAIPISGAPDAAEAPLPKLPVPDTHGGLPPEILAEPAASLEVLAELRPLGQIQDSFIVAAGRDGFWIIDQHVAHERILFEKLLRQRAAGRVEMQRLLMPLVIPLSVAQEVEFERIAEELNASGFELEPFGRRTVAVKAAPAGIAAGDIEKVLFEILEIAEKELRRMSMDDLRRAVAAAVACRAAIKINTRLEANKMEWLLRALAASECPMTCPHGRPIALHYSMRDILKGFRRL